MRAMLIMLLVRGVAPPPAFAVQSAGKSAEINHLTSSWSLAAADGMEHVGRGWKPSSQTTPHTLDVSLAKDETENVQTVILGGMSGCTIARIEVPRLASGAKTSQRAPTVAVHPIGFVPNGPCPAQSATVYNESCPGEAPFRAHDGSCVSNSMIEAGIAPGCSRDGPFPGAPVARSWPFVLLPASKWLAGDFDVKPNTAQPLMVVVATTNETDGGEWCSVVRVIDRDGVRRSLDLRITVFNFTLPPASLPALFGVRGEWASRFGWPSKSYEQFLLSHRIPVASLIHGPAGWPSVSANASRLRWLWDNGQRVWIIGSMNDLCQDLSQSECESRGPGETAISKLLVQMKSAQMVADQAGWPRDKQLAYIGSEPKTWMIPALARILPIVRQHFPDITIVSVGIVQFVCASGLRPDGVTTQKIVGCPTAVQEVDLFLPRSIYYTNYSKFAADTLRSVTNGRQRVGWYTSGVPTGPGALNFFLQLPPMHSRLLTGVATWKVNASAFLYYRLDTFAGYVGPDKTWRPLEPAGTERTLDIGDFAQTQEDYDGEGMLFVPSTAGPLSTIHLESLRDGLEDNSYFVVLRALVERARAAGIAISPSIVAAETIEDTLFRELKAEAVVMSVDGLYATKPVVLRAKRHAVAEAILELGAALRNSSRPSPDSFGDV